MLKVCSSRFNSAVGYFSNDDSSLSGKEDPNVQIFSNVVTLTEGIHAVDPLIPLLLWGIHT